ncbi:MAG: DUF4252 domain-containing protein [Mariniphaga sp.]|nr:DUF4252 domain-containing protein [Mariniphaga sp.]
MKKLIVLIIAVLVLTPVFSQDMFKQLTDKYSDQDGFSATMITNDMFDLYLRKKNIEKDSPVYETLKKLDNVLVASQSKFGSKEEIDVKGLHSEILSNYQKGNYTLLKTEKKMGEDIKVYLKKSNDKVNSLALVTASSTSVNLVEMNGDIDLASLSELSDALSIRGLENLYKINGGSSFQFYGGTFTAPEYLYNYSRDFFNEDRLIELQQRIKEQGSLSEEQVEKYQQQAKEMGLKQAEMAEKYRQMAEQYGRKPIFLSYPGDTNTVYYIDGKKVKVVDIKNLDREKIDGIEVNKMEDDEGNVIYITTKKKKK